MDDSYLLLSLPSGSSDSYRREADVVTAADEDAADGSGPPDVPDKSPDLLGLATVVDLESVLIDTVVGGLSEVEVELAALEVSFSCFAFAFRASSERGGMSYDVGTFVCVSLSQGT